MPEVSGESRPVHSL